MPWHKSKKIEKNRICAMAYFEKSKKLGFMPWHKLEKSKKLEFSNVCHGINSSFPIYSMA
jgi:hypothetical protein